MSRDRWRSWSPRWWGHATFRATVRKESNASNAVILGIYTVVDGVLAYLLLGISLTLWLPALLFAGLIGAAFGYNVMVMSFALKLEV